MILKEKKIPNWTENTLKVSGPKEILKVFRKTAEGEYPWGDGQREILSLNSFIPVPKEAMENYSDIGYFWCVTKWGTKWGCCDIELMEKPRSLIYYFNSAWSPPLPSILAMSKQFPKLNFSLRYFEGGMAFQGLFRCKGGRIIQQKHGDYRGHRGG